jgi:hypothetical protein
MSEKHQLNCTEKLSEEHKKSNLIWNQKNKKINLNSKIIPKFYELNNKNLDKTKSSFNSSELQKIKSFTKLFNNGHDSLKQSDLSSSNNLDDFKKRKESSESTKSFDPKKKISGKKNGFWDSVSSMFGCN